MKSFGKKICIIYSNKNFVIIKRAVCFCGLKLSSKAKKLSTQLSVNKGKLNFDTVYSVKIKAASYRPIDSGVVISLV